MASKHVSFVFLDFKFQVHFFDSRLQVHLWISSFKFFFDFKCVTCLHGGFSDLSKHVTKFAKQFNTLAFT